MSTTEHKYAKGIEFNVHPKEKFNELLDQVKAISETDYNDEARDGFRDLVNYWNERSTRRFNDKLRSNARNI